MSRFFVVALSFSLSSCAFLQKRLAVKNLQFSLQSVIIRSLTFQRLGMEINLKAFNPNDVEAVMDRMDYTIYFEGVKAIYGSTQETYRVAPKGSKLVKVSGYIDFVDLPQVFKAIKNSANKQRVKIKAVLKPHVKTMLGTITKSITIEKYIPLYWK